jgi:hypothetical protein
MAIDFSTQEGKALFEREVRMRMEPPFYMGREKAEMLVAVLLREECQIIPTEESVEQLKAEVDHLRAVLRAFTSHYPHGVNPMLDQAYADARDALEKD